jgi:hypothetical protein
VKAERTNKVSWLVVSFTNGRLRTAKVCRTERSRTRIANYLNEYAAAANRLRGNLMEFVAVIDEKELLPVLKPHAGLPKHQSRAELKRAKVKRDFRITPVKGRAQ